MSGLETLPVFQEVDAGRWVLPTRMEPFLRWLDVAFADVETDEDAVRLFLLTDAGELMPETLKDDLRKAGLL